MPASRSARLSWYSVAAVAAVALAILLVWTAAAAVPSSDARAGSLERPFADGRVRMALQRTADGTAELHVFFLDDAGQPRPVNAPHVSLSTGDENQPVELTNAGPGHLLGTRPTLPRDGPYEVEIRAEIDGSAYRTDGSVAVDTPDRTVAQRVVAWCSLQLARSRE